MYCILPQQGNICIIKIYMKVVSSVMFLELYSNITVKEPLELPTAFHLHMEIRISVLFACLCFTVLVFLNSLYNS